MQTPKPHASCDATSPKDSIPGTLSSNRLCYIDNLRTCVILLVVVLHTLITYSHIGSWYYNESNSVDAVSAVIFLTFQAHFQAFAMGLLFLVAGYFTPTSYDHKGFRHFLGDRFMRLGVPSLVYMLLIHPLMVHYLLSHGKSFGGYYRDYILKGNVLSGNGPMWFAVALLVFSLVYAVIRATLPAGSAPLRLSAPGWKGLACMGLGLGAVTFLVRLVQPIGTNVFNMQLCFFPQYIALFTIGIVARRNDWFASFSKRFGCGMLVGTLVISPIIFVAMVLGAGFPEHSASSFTGGWHWESAAYAFGEQLFCMPLCVGLLAWFRERINQGSRIWKALAADSFGVYFLHPPVVVAITQAFGWLTLPAIAKTIVVAPIAVLSTLVAVHWVARRIPLFRRIL